MSCQQTQPWSCRGTGRYCQHHGAAGWKGWQHQEQELLYEKHMPEP